MGSLRVLLVVVSILLVQTVCGNFSFESFSEKNNSLFMFNNSCIALQSLQVTAETLNDEPQYSPKNRSGRVIYSKPYRLWKKSSDSPASFNSTFVFNIKIPDNGTAGGEGMAFIIYSNKDIENAPVASYGQWLGLFDSSIDGLKSNKMVAVEFDTKKNEGTNDPDDNHVAIDVNSINSSRIESLDVGSINLKNGENITAWIQYSGSQLQLKVYIAKSPDRMPSKPILQYPINLSQFLGPFVYFGFTASTGNSTELNCVHSWSLSIQDLRDFTANKGLIIGLSVGGAALALLFAIAILIILFIKHRKHRAEAAIISDALRKLPGHPHEFKYKDLQKATHNFSSQSEIGSGGFGTVYKAHLRRNKTAVAVKRIFKDSTQGAEEFISEIRIINRLRHRNLVPLLGWCHDKGNLLLVYEYMPNGSLEKYIWKGHLDWDQRYNIISGVASALVYLHEESEEQVIHRDLKPSNIMLDSEYNARLGDFGLARIIQPNRTSYTSSRVGGTIGYIAPECFHTGKATAESDVFSFGAVVLEVVCGKPPWCGEDGLDLVGTVWKLYRENKLLQAADRLPMAPPADTLATVNDDDITCLLMVGLACSNPNPRDRPTMRQVKQMLCKERPLPHVPTFRPPFVWLHPDSSDSGFTTASSLSTETSRPL